MTPDFLTPGWWVLLLLVLLGAGVAVTWQRRRQPAAGEPDIKWPSLEPNLEWDTAAGDSLARIYAYVVAVSDSTIQWYRTRRRPKRLVGFCLRLAALILTVAAGLVPLSSIPPVWSTVMLAAAGLLVSVDHFAGFTSGWIRYMLAQQKVERVKSAFLMDWNALKAAQAETPAMLERARTFLLAVDKVVADETQEWAAEFQSALKEMEKARKEAGEIERTGALEVTVRNPKDVTAWTLEIDGSQRGRTSGRNLAVTDVAAGIRKLKVYGDNPQGQRLSDEKTVRVEGGATATQDLELS